MRPEGPKKNFFEAAPPPPPSIYLKVDPATAVLHGVEITEVRNWQDCLEKEELCGIRPPLLDFFCFSKACPIIIDNVLTPFYFSCLNLFFIECFCAIEQAIAIQHRTIFFHNFIVFISLSVGNRRSGIEKNDVSYVLNKDFRLSSLLTDAAAEALARKRETSAAQ